MVKYYIYHIPGVKIGVSRFPEARVKAQNYTDFEILEEHTDIDTVSNREQELQKEYGYPVDNCKYKTTVNSCNETQYYFTKEELYELYINQKISSLRIAKKFKCRKEIILKHLRLYNIPIRTTAEARILAPNKYDNVKIDKEDLYKYYIEDKLLVRDIAKIYKCNQGTIQKNLRKFNISRKHILIKKDDTILRDNIIQLYNMGIKVKEISKIVNVCKPLIRKILKENSPE